VSCACASRSWPFTAVALVLPADDNTVCLGCHDPAVAPVVYAEAPFTAGPVDYSACRACHWAGMSTDLEGDPYTIWGWWTHKHLVYDPGTSCFDCHWNLAYPDIVDYPTPTYATDFGYFDSADSLTTSAGELHAIHVNGSWPATAKYTSQNYCASCHAAARCEACHADLAHGAHTAGAYPGETYVSAPGTPEGDPEVLTAAPGEVTCTSSACHPRASVASRPLCGSCHAVEIARHDAAHDASAYVTTGCNRCHGSMLDAIHVMDCAVCHASVDPNVISAVEAGSRDCASCHGSTQHFGRRK